MRLPCLSCDRIISLLFFLQLHQPNQDNIHSLILFPFNTLTVIALLPLHPLFFPFFYPVCYLYQARCTICARSCWCKCHTSLTYSFFSLTTRLSLVRLPISNTSLLPFIVFFTFFPLLPFLPLSCTLY